MKETHLKRDDLEQNLYQKLPINGINLIKVNLENQGIIVSKTTIRNVVRGISGTKFPQIYSVAIEIRDEYQSKVQAINENL